MKRRLLFDLIFSNFFEALSKQYIVTKQQHKILNLEPCIFFEKTNLIFCHFSKIWEFNNLCDVIKSKLGQKDAKFVYYIIPTVIKRSNLIMLVFSRLLVYFWDQFFKIVILCPIPNPSFSVSSKIVSKEVQSCIYSTIGEKRLKTLGNQTLRWEKCLWA